MKWKQQFFSVLTPPSLWPYFFFNLASQRAAFRKISWRGKINSSPNNNPKLCCCYSGTIFLAMIFWQEIFIKTKVGFVLKSMRSRGNRYTTEMTGSKGKAVRKEGKQFSFSEATVTASLPDNSSQIRPLLKNLLKSNPGFVWIMYLSLSLLVMTSQKFWSMKLHFSFFESHLHKATICDPILTCRRDVLSLSDSSEANSHFRLAIQRPAWPL